MLSLAVTLFLAGLITILLPCILPLVPIVVGASITGRHPLRPLVTVIGMVVSFVAFSFLLFVVLDQFVEAADILRIATYDLLLLFGVGFLTQQRMFRWLGALAGCLFFLTKGWVVVVFAALAGVVAMEVGGWMATRFQQLGSDVQLAARTGFGSESLVTAFIVGLTLGLVWIPCAGPALSFAFTLVREEPGLRALVLLTVYSVGAAIPLLIVGYGGQVAVHSTRTLAAWSGRIKQVAGVLLILSAVAFHLMWFMKLQLWLTEHTSYGTFASQFEQQLFGEDMFEIPFSPSTAMGLPVLPKMARAPEFAGLGPWHNSEPFTLESLKGKVVLVDFWTYSCINCIRTLPYIQGYWDTFKDKPFVLIGVHAPEFVFEKSEKNVAQAVREYGLTYPIAQDNDFGTWRAFANRYWPAKYLIDANGIIRYTHFGEGAYDETNLAIQSLLAEIGAIEVPMPMSDTAARTYRKQTPETYLGERSWPVLGNAQGEPTSAVVSYTLPESRALHHYYLRSDWQLVDGERQVLRKAPGQIRMRFLGSEINLVMGLEEGVGTVVADIEVDGETMPPVEIDRHALYELFRGDYGEHEITIYFRKAGVAAYAFTFGS